MKGKKILLTTPDYPPKLGGLSTFAINIEKVLKDEGNSVELLVWKTVKDLKHVENKNVDLIVNVHLWGGYYLKKKFPEAKYLNFLHGSEILFTSPNIFKAFYKIMLRKSVFEFLRQAELNVYISNFTKNKISELGFKTEYNRDLLFHNCIDTADKDFINLDLDDDIVFCCIARDVPHKNMKGSIELVEKISTMTGRKCSLYLNSTKYSSKVIELKNVGSLSDPEREGIYKKAHFNLLLSKDHSHRGYFEGFGLTCLEAGKYGTPSIVLAEAGLEDNIHHSINGLKLTDETCEEEISSLVLPFLDNNMYFRLRESTFTHTIGSHGLDQYARLFKCLVA